MNTEGIERNLEIGTRVEETRDSYIPLTVRFDLNSLFSKRNIIAHQYDRSHYTAEMGTISKDLVNSLIHDVTKEDWSLNCKCSKL